ncbi:MAG: hypothetical protein EOO75_00065 [Myxococcales bacterium]|nr:MAG: hypothetical protein EOO75_00065 [Myxococcales bacterium]
MSVRSLALVAIVAGLLGCDRTETPLQEGPLSASKGSATAAPVKPEVKPEAKPMVKLDYTLTITDPGKPAVTTEYTVNVEENSRGEVRQMRNVPLTTAPPASASAAPVVAGPRGSAHPAGPRGSAHPAPVASGPARPMLPAPRQDVGTLLRASFALAGEAMTVHTDFELSDVDDSAIAKIYKVSLKGDALVTPGKPSVVATSEDPGSHRRYQLSVAATKLR